jgi:phenylacetate-CoA ligase
VARSTAAGSKLTGPERPLTPQGDGTAPEWTDTGFVSPRTSQADFLWPATPPPLDATLYAFLFQLERTQWWSAERLHAYQLLQLSTLVAHAAEHVPFCKHRFAGLAGLGAGALSHEMFTALPILTRAEAVQAGDALASRAPPKGHGAPRALTTSGSSGTPFQLKRTQLDGLMAAALVQRGHLWHRRDMSLTHVTIARPDAGGAGQRDAWSQFLPTGPAHLLDLARPADALLADTVALAPAYLSVWPSLLAEMLRLSAETGARPEGLQQVLTYGETVPPGLAALCEQVWGAALVDAYSCEEIGGLALQCPHGNMHIQSEHALVEVLDDANRSCAVGETGRVVATNLHNFATPTIRMELGDLATVGAPCPCGRGLPVLARIDGRVRDLLTLPDGRRILPSFDEARICAAAPTLRQFQLAQLADGRIEARIISAASLRPTEEAALTQAFNDGFGHRFDFTFSPVDAIARAPGGKIRRWVAG